MRAQVVLLAALSVAPGQAGPQGVFQTDFQERAAAPQAAPSPRRVAPQAAPARGLAPRRPAPRPTQQPDRRETTTHVEILKQINEHNEDGSYTYGYEGSDGSFKLETRFADGRVQGKYGYIDVNGEVKIIEYGADAMGFQPTGDLPEGIIIPEPVLSNCTDGQGNDCDYNDYDSYYDYDQENQSKKEDSRREIVNRARASAEQASNTQRANLNQHRGQQLSAPITPAPLPRQQTAAAPLRSRPAPPPRPAFRPAPAAPAFRPAPAAPAFRPAAPAAPQPFLPTPPPPRAPKNPGSSSRNPSRGRQSGRAGGRLQAQAPRAQAPRAQAPRAQAPRAQAPRAEAPRAQAPSSAAAFPTSSQGGGFSNFPARTGGAPRARTRPAAPRQAPPPPRQSPRLQERPAPVALPPPSFQTSFNQQPAFPARPARPALTFQEDRASPDLPASALEVVDFNELLGVFQQGSPRQQAAPQRFAPPARRDPGRALPGVFQSANFPVRFY